jgi:hypothetical protein
MSVGDEPEQKSENNNDQPIAEKKEEPVQQLNEQINIKLVAVFTYLLL